MSADDWAQRLGRETVHSADRWRLALAVLPEPLQEDERFRAALVELGTLPSNTPEGAAKMLLKSMADYAEGQRGMVFGTGETTELTPERMERMSDLLEREAETHVKMGRHFWVVLVAHRGSDKLLDSFDAAHADPSNPPTLDADTIVAQPELACYVCAVAYEPRLRRRKCPGVDPWGGGVRSAR